MPIIRCHVVQSTINTYDFLVFLLLLGIVILLTLTAYDSITVLSTVYCRTLIGSHTSNASSGMLLFMTGSA